MNRWADRKLRRKPPRELLRETREAERAFAWERRGLARGTSVEQHPVYSPECVEGAFPEVGIQDYA